MGCGACSKVHHPIKDNQNTLNSKRSEKTARKSKISRTSTELEQMQNSAPDTAKPKDTQRESQREQKEEEENLPSSTSGIYSFAKE